LVNLRINGIEFAYNEKKIIKDLGFELFSGQFISLIGPNGSGKSTLLKIINRILKPQEGEVLINGNNIKRINRIDLARIMAYVPQSEGPLFSTTVFDTILSGRRPYFNWRVREEDYKIVLEIINRLGLKEIAGEDINAISGGQRQKVIIARALAQKPQIMLLDEPVSNLDLKHQVDILELLKEESEKGLSIIMAIHDLSLVSRYSDRIIILKEGEVFASGDQRVINKENIESVYKVRVNIVNYQGNLLIIPEGKGKRNLDTKKERLMI